MHLTSTIGNATFRQIVGCELHRDFVTGENADIVFAHLAGNMGGHHMTIFQLDPKHSIRKGLHDSSFHLNMVFFGQVLVHPWVGGVIRHNTASIHNFRKQTTSGASYIDSDHFSFDLRSPMGKGYQRPVNHLSITLVEVMG